MNAHALNELISLNDLIDAFANGIVMHLKVSLFLMFLPRCV